MAKRMFEISDSKPLLAQWHVSVDITDWLSTDTISNVDFTAKILSTGADATATVLDAVKSIWQGAVLKPYIKAGSSGVTYRIKMIVTTALGDKEVFWLDFTAKDEDE